MRLLVTSDLHFDHGRSRLLAEEAAEKISALGREGGFDALLVVGDTATSRGDALERGLGRLAFDGPKLLTLGNHELWSTAEDWAGNSLELYERGLPDRVAAAGWHCLDREPFVAGDVAVVGNVGWYDFAFAPGHLRVPRRFYEAKVAPGSAAYYTAFRHLFEPADDIPAAAHEIFARWNDGRYVRWPAGMDDAGFTALLLARLEAHLERVRGAKEVLVAVHHLPLRELLPPPSSPAWDFAKAYLGSPAFGELIARYPNVSRVVCGHSHYENAVELAGKQWTVTGSGYREKHWSVVELPGAAADGR